MSMSSTLRCQCSPKVVQPIPTTATWSRMPLLAMGRSLRHDSGFPEVVVYAPGAVEPPERQRYPGADGDVCFLRVGQLEQGASAAVEVDDRVDDRRARR